MNEFLKNVLVILISVTISMQWCNSHFGKRSDLVSPLNQIVRNAVPAKSLTVTNYFTITNYVTVTNFSDISDYVETKLSPGIPIKQETQTVSTTDIQPPAENEIRLRKIAKELTDLLDGVKIEK